VRAHHGPRAPAVAADVRERLRERWSRHGTIWSNCNNC
jgi:hypothetical protein